MKAESTKHQDGNQVGPLPYKSDDLLGKKIERPIGRGHPKQKGNPNQGHKHGT